MSFTPREVATPEPDEESCRRYFDNNRQQLDRPDRYDASHILLASPADDTEARKADTLRARDIIAALQAEPHRFAEFALAHSACPSRDQGGHLGLVSRGDTIPEFETYLFSLAPGELCPVPIETREGWLLLYHGVSGPCNGFVYSMGAALLDLTTRRACSTGPAITS